MLKESKAFSGIAVRDVEEARRFYGDVLGLTVEPGEMGMAVLRLGGDRPVPLTDLFAQIARIAADRRGTLPVPVQPSAPPAHASPLDAADVSVDSTPFRSITGWRPVVPDDDGLLDLITALADEADGTAQHHHGGSARSESHPTAEHLEAAS